MVECYLKNVTTGKPAKDIYHWKGYSPKELIGRTFRINNEYYICSAANTVPDKEFINPTSATLLAENSGDTYQAIGVKFPNKPTEYHYFISKKDCFSIGRDSELIIRTPYGEQRAIITTPYIPPELAHATKVIDIVRKAGQTPRITTEVAKVRFIDGKGISTTVYTYEFKNSETIPLKNKLYWLKENKSLVIVDDIVEVQDTSSFRRKNFSIPTFEQISDSFENTDNAAVLYWLKCTNIDNLDCYCQNYINQLTSGRKPSQLIYGNVTNSLNSTGQAAQCATVAYSDFANTINSYSDSVWTISIDNNNNNDNKGEDKMNMNKMFKNFEFGKINTDAIKFSINGLAFKQADGSYATYSAEKHEFTDVSAFVMDTDFIFAMPVAIKDLKKGDIVKHLNRYVIIEGIFEEDGTIKAVDPLAGEEKVIIPIKNMFGFNYYTKIMNIFDGMNMTPNAENPFGNFLPFLMMRDGGFDDTMMLAMMMQNNGNSADFMSNPFMMMALLKK